MFFGHNLARPGEIPCLSGCLRNLVEGRLAPPKRLFRQNAEVFHQPKCGGFGGISPTFMYEWL